MKRIAIVAASWMTAVSAIAAPSLIPPRVEQAILDRTSAGQNPTIVIAVVDGDRSAIYAFGKLDNGTAPTGSTIYEIGSITKTFTATLLADSVIKGQLRLDQPLSTLLPDFKIPSKDGKVITLENIAEQNSGLPRLPTNMHPADPTDPYVDYDSAKLQQFLATYTLPRLPGAGYEYSNLAVGLLGYALARHADSSYPALVERTIFEPLGMKDSSVTIGKADPPNMAPGHDAAGKEVPTWHLDALAGAGGIRSTGDDMLRYLKANMGLTPSPLLRAMQLAQISRAQTTSPDSKIGLIWMTRHSVDSHDGPDVVWHGGMTGGYASFIGFTADHQHGVVVLTNAQINVDDLGFATLLIDWPLAKVHKQVLMSPSALSAYQGVYQLSPHMVLRVALAGNQVMVQATGQGPVPLFPSAPNEFFARIANITISFQRDAHDQVVGLILHQSGDHSAPKVTEAMAAKVEGIKQVNLDPATLQNYVGRYDMAPGVSFVVTINQGQLMVKLADQPSLPVYAGAKDRFLYRVVDAQIDFERDSSGKVIALVLHQNGQQKRAPKVSD